MASTIHPSHPAHSSSLSFSRSANDVAAFTSPYPQYASPGYADPYAHAPQPNGIARSGSSLESNFAHVSASSKTDRPVVYTAVYSNVQVYEMEIGDMAVMRRRKDSWLNATQILKVARIEKGRRTKILEKEILTGVHEKVQGGYGRYQGTWINYNRGREFCRQYGVEDLLRPLLDYDIQSDGTESTTHNDTPTKEQAQAANRKKLFNSSIDQRVNGISSRSTFFQNISPTASNALAAMNKAARYDSPLQRPASAQRRPSDMMQRQTPSHIMLGADPSFHSTSQQNFLADHASFDPAQAQMYAALNGQSHGLQADASERPRKRMRTSFPQDPYLDPVLQDDTPTEYNGSFSQSTPSQFQHMPRESDQGFLSLAPLPAPDGKAGEEKRVMLLDLFAEPRIEYFSHEAIQKLSGQELDIPLDPKGNTALHWAGMLGKVSVIKALVANGANIFRGNAGGETALMHAVQVNNTHQQNNFAEMLESLGPLIELRDAAGRTVLHHIAVASGIKGRTQSSRYYLESLLAYTVRPFMPGGDSLPNSQNSQANANTKLRPMNLARFMSEIVNIQDKTGNTALNLVSRIGSHTIINQLEEVGADFSIGNHKGFRPESFGIFPKSHNGAGQQGSQAANSLAASQTSSGAEVKATSKVDRIREEIVATTQTILTSTATSYTTELTRLTEALHAQTSRMRDLETERAFLSTRLTDLKAAARLRRSQSTRRRNLSAVVQKLRERSLKTETSKAAQGQKRKRSKSEMVLSPTSPAVKEKTEYLHTLHTSLTSQTQSIVTQLGAVKTLAANEKNEEREGMFRKVVSLCTGVPEGEVDGVLDGLVGAVEGSGSR